MTTSSCSFLSATFVKICINMQTHTCICNSKFGNTFSVVWDRVSLRSFDLSRTCYCSPGRPHTWGYIPVLASWVLVLQACSYCMCCWGWNLGLYVYWGISLPNWTTTPRPEDRILTQKCVFCFIFILFLVFSTQLYPDITISATEIGLLVFQPVGLQLPF